MDVLQFLFIFLVTFFGLLCICICILYCVCEKGCLKKKPVNKDIEKQSNVSNKTTKSGKEEVEMEDRKMYVHLDRRSKILHKQLSAEFASELKKGDNVSPQKIKSRNSIDMDKEESLRRNNNNKEVSTKITSKSSTELSKKPQEIVDDNSSFYMEQHSIRKTLEESRDSMSSSRTSLLESTGIADLMGARRLSTANDFASLIPKEEQ